MEIIWLGHSCFRIKGKEAILVTDPCGPQMAYNLGKLVANVVTLSHFHAGHRNYLAVGNEPKVISGPGEYEVADILITGVGSYHDGEQGAIRGRTTIYSIEIDDIVICHLGDLGHGLSLHEVEELGNIEILMVPVGGGSTIDAKVASEVVRLANPKVIIPMHYGTDVTPWLDSVDGFLREMGVKETARQDKLNITRSNMPSESQVILLTYSQ